MERTEPGTTELEISEGRAPAVLLGAALLLAALNLRPAIASLSPVLGAVRRTADLSPVEAGFLTTLPLVCFGVIAFLAPRLVRRVGASALLFTCLTVLAAGTVIRSLPSTAALFFGTFTIGAIIGVANVLMPGIVKKDFPRHVGLMTGLFTMALAGGPALATGLSVPTYHAFGNNWRLSLGFWALPAALAALVWLPLRHNDRPDRGIDLAPLAKRISFRDPVALSVTVFMGTQSLVFYTILAWMPTILQAHGVSVEEAGFLLALVNIVGIAAALLAPVIAHRMPDERAAAIVSTLCLVSGVTGLLVEPRHALVLWSILLGIGQGSAISLALMMMVVRARNAAQANSLSGLAQGIGYLIAAAGPATAGALYSATGGWDATLLLMLAVLVPQFFAAWRGGHGVVGARAGS